MVFTVTDLGGVFHLRTVGRSNGMYSGCTTAFNCVRCTLPEKVVWSILFRFGLCFSSWLFNSSGVFMSFPCVSSTYLPRTCPVLMLLSHALQRSICLILLFLWRLLLRSSLALSLCGFCFFDVNLGLNLSLVLEGFLCKFCCTFAAKAFRCSARFLDTASCSQDSHRSLFAMHCFLSSPDNE